MKKNKIIYLYILIKEGQFRIDVTFILVILRSKIEIFLTNEMSLTQRPFVILLMIILKIY